VRYITELSFTRASVRYRTVVPAKSCIDLVTWTVPRRIEHCKTYFLFKMMLSMPVRFEMP
jgi:hypothetical protein